MRDPHAIQTSGSQPTAAIGQSAWPISPYLLLCGLVMFLSLGQRHSFGLYMVPVTSTWGWGRESFSLAIALQNLVWGVAQPFSGMLADRIGARRVMVLGGVLYTAGLALMPWSHTGLLFAITAGVLVGLGLSGTAFGIVYGAVGKSVSAASRPAALGLVGAIGGAGQFFMLPLNLWLLDTLGWSRAVWLLSVLVAAIIPLALCARPPADVATNGPLLDLRASLRQAFSDRDFWLLSMSFLSCGFQLAFIATHLPAYLADNRLQPGVATTALGLIALANIAGTYLFGRWGALWLNKNLLAGLYAARAAAILLFLLLPVTPASVYVFAAVMGFLWLATVPLTSGTIGKLYGVRYLGTLFGFVFLSHQIGSFVGVWLGGWMFDHFHSYTGVWILAAALSVMSALVNLPIREHRVVAAAAAGA